MSHLIPPQTVTFSSGEALGRNNWFRPHEAILMDFSANSDPSFCLEIVSQRPGDTAPIVLRCSAADALALGHAIVSMSTAILAAPISEFTRGNS